LIGDLIAHKGMFLENYNLVKRMNILYRCLEHEFFEDEYDICFFQVKKYFTYDQIEYAINEFIPLLKYTCRGLYFKPLFIRFKNILINFDDSLIQKVMRKKYKSVSNFLLLEDTNNLAGVKSTAQTGTSISKVSSYTDLKEIRQFHVHKTTHPDIYELTSEEDGKVFGTACIPTLQVSKMMRKLFSDLNVTDKLLMECKLSEKFDGKYVPCKVLVNKMM
jgi:hypothetical protein